MRPSKILRNLSFQSCVCVPYVQKWNAVSFLACLKLVIISTSRLALVTIMWRDIQTLFKCYITTRTPSPSPVFLSARPLPQSFPNPNPLTSYRNFFNPELSKMQYVCVHWCFKPFILGHIVAIVLVAFTNALENALNFKLTESCSHIEYVVQKDLWVFSYVSSLHVTHVIFWPSWQLWPPTP